MLRPMAPIRVSASMVVAWASQNEANPWSAAIWACASIRSIEGLPSIPDALMSDYARHLWGGVWGDLRTRCEAAVRGEGDPMAAKQALAARVVEALHGRTDAEWVGMFGERYLAFGKVDRALDGQRSG